jgi:cytochrome c-type biogenesis protein CcmH
MWKSMILWVAVALMTAAAMCAVGWPLTRRTHLPVNETEGDVAIYRDQMAEIERDCAAGLLGTREAEAARLEVSRRLIAAADAGEVVDERRGETPRFWRVAAAGAAVALPLCGFCLYLALGSPNLSDERLEARTAQTRGNDQSVEALFAKIEAHLEQHPDDGRGWEVIAPVYMRVGRYDDAVQARANALRLLGSTSNRQADLGEALVAAGNGLVTAEAKAAFDAAIRLDGSNATARFYEGLAAEQDGNRAEASRIWHALLDSAPPGAPWLGFVRQEVARLDSSAPSAPQSEGGALADRQEAMIRAMVDQLAARLHRDGSDVEGWVRLVRSYRVLGENDKVDTTIAEAKAALASNPDKLRDLDDGLKSLAQEPGTTVSSPAADPATNRPPAATAGVDPMVRGMVDRLEARLHQDGSDVEGWIQLVRSYKVLGEFDRMHTAIGDARQALANDPDRLRRLDEGVRNLGVGS